MKRKITLIFTLFILLFIFNINIISKAETFDPNFLENAKSAILIELNTGEILYAKDKDIKKSPASMTKIMSMYIILEAIDKNMLKWDDKITVSSHAASMGGSQVYLAPGEVMSVDDLFKCMTVASANDATVALAEAVSGSEELFVKNMNEKVREFGLTNTIFKDSTGLTDFSDGHFSTAHDMAFIARELLKKYGDVVLKYTSIYEDYIRENTDKKFWLVNTNKLVKHVKGIDGLKTGWTREAGYNLTATMKKDNMRLISVVMGSETGEKRNFDTVKLLNYGFAQYQLVHYKPKNYQVDEYNNILLKPNKIKVIVKDDVYFVVKKGETLDKLEERIQFNIGYNKLKKGDVVGNLEILKNNIVIYSVPLTVDTDVKKANVFEVFLRLLKEVFY